MGRKPKRGKSNPGESVTNETAKEQQQDKNAPTTLLYKHGAAYSGTIATRGFFQKLAGFAALVGLILFMTVFTDPTQAGETSARALRQIMERFTSAMGTAGKTLMSSPGGKGISETLDSLLIDPSRGRVALIWLGIIFFVVCPCLIRIVCSVLSYFAGWKAAVKMAAVAAEGAEGKLKTCRAKSSLNLRIVNTVLGLLVGIPLFVVAILLANSLLTMRVVRVEPRTVVAILLIIMLLCC